MARIQKALLGSGFTYAQFALAIVSGFILLPIIIWNVGAYNYGLWLVSGELTGYLLLGDLGVFTILPWLVANRDGAGDRLAVGRYLSDSLLVGLVVGLCVIAAAIGIWHLNPAWIGVNPADLATIRLPLTLLLVLTGVGFPFRVFPAILCGIQDVVFVGSGNFSQAALTVAFTATLTPLGFGLPGLAVSLGVPPLLFGIAGAARLAIRHSEILRSCQRPAWTGCRFLIGQGLGVWMGSLGNRLLTASNGLVMVALGRPDWATMYAATGKVAQVSQQICWVVPDNGLIGLSQLYGERNAARTRQAVQCLLLLYLLIPGGAAIELLICNPWFVQHWLGQEVYAGDYVSGLIALNLISVSALSGLLKVVSVVGNRIRISIMTVIQGLATSVLGYLLAKHRGPAGLAEGAIIAATIIAIPYAFFLCKTTFGFSSKELLANCFGGWAVRAVPLMAFAAIVGHLMPESPFVLIVAAICFSAAYAFFLRPVIDRSPWPDTIRKWLIRMRLIPFTPRSTISSTCERGGEIAG